MYKIGLPGKLILGDYFQENRTSQRPFLLLRISFHGRPIFIQLPPDLKDEEKEDIARVIQKPKVFHGLDYSEVQKGRPIGRNVLKIIFWEVPLADWLRR